MSERGGGSVTDVARRACASLARLLATASTRRDPRGRSRRHRESDARRGETLAASHLESCGCTIVARNLRVGRDEADLVAAIPPERDGDPPVLAIVEVKTSRTLHAPPHLRIDAGKRRRLVRLATRLLANRALEGAFIRFDAVGVDLSRDPPAVEHLPGCFDASSPIDRGGPRRRDRDEVG